MNEVLRLKECIKIAERHIDMETESGSHTIHSCKCGRGCREIKCDECWKKDLEDYKKQLKEKKK